ncbi:MAG: glycosyl hydrolase, partial [Bacteroidetes bacterium]|nr:glycosyl hydrolase [Bacteroidota bacterium]
MFHRILLTTVLGLFAMPAFSQKAAATATPAAAKDTVNPAWYSSLKFRMIGPAVNSGRIIDLAVNPQNHSEYYVAAACGGVWKTNNRSITFQPIFDQQRVYSIGCLTLDPGNANTLWV